MCHGAPWDVMGEKLSMGCDTPLIFGTLSHGIWFAGENRYTRECSWVIISHGLV